MNFNPGINALLQYDITEIIETMMDFVDFIDNDYQNYTNNKIMRYWQAKDVTLKSVFLTDLLDWLCCLAFSDGFIASEEVEFINIHLKQNFSSDDIIDLCKFRINQDYFKHLPLSFILIYEHDLLIKSLDMCWDLNSVEQLYKLFMIIGVQFIHCDNETVAKEWRMLNRYTEDLSNRINDFDIIQDQLAVLESSNRDEYLEKRYPFNWDIYCNYREELCDLDSLKDLTEEFENNDVSSKSNSNPWVMNSNDNPSSYWQPRKIKTRYSWDLEKNINAYYDFTGEFDNHLADINDIVTEENREKLENIHLTPQQYIGILNKIKSTSDNILYRIFNENYIDFNSLSIFEKIVLFTNSFVESEYKSDGDELGVYSLNKIHLDDRFDTAIQIITLIHELAHHLLAEIFEQAVMILFNTDKTDAVEWFVDISMKSSDNYVLLNEYCAHSVESHFTPFEYQNYGSYFKVLERFDENKFIDKQIVLYSMMIGNTFCQDILTIIKPFIDNQLKEEITQEFNKNQTDFLNHDGISLEIEDTVNINQLLHYINVILISGFNNALN